MAKRPNDQLRDTSIVVLELESGERFIVASLSKRRDTQVITIDPTTGALLYTGREGFDNFPSEADALQHVTAGSRWPPVKTIHARAILGYAALGTFGLLLVATKLRAGIQPLPGGDTVCLVEESQWVKVNLRDPHPLSKADVKNIGDLQEIDIDGMHYFCETRDITRPFPSEYPVEDYDKEFVWNDWLSSPFKDLGLRHHCVVLLQGVADSRVFTDTQGHQVTVALIARRSRLHPGTRYLARGLNAACSTGNEVECEQLLWPSRMSRNQSIPFSVYLWRRGTVPIWWKAEIKSTVGEAEICVSDIDPYRGSEHYFCRLGLRYGDENINLERFKNKHRLPIVCVNLLRSGVGKPELVLSEHFQECVDYIGKKNELSNVTVSLIDYDWHANTKLIGDARAVEKFWQLLKPSIMDVGFYMGDYLPSLEMRKDPNDFILQNHGLMAGVFRLTRKQWGILRFNCADSLDRTNAASFFVAVQVMAEQCRHLGLSLDLNRHFETSLSFNEKSGERVTSKGFLGPLPLGWESRTDVVTGKVFYIDHNTRRTTWKHPCPDKPWRRLDMMVEEFKEATLPSPISVLADMFLTAGDVHATLYTGSRAMHSHILQIFSDESAKSKQYVAAQNMKITLQRRYLNVIVDSSRQKQLEMFLGLHRHKHLPTVRDRSLQVLSRPYSCLLKPVQSSFPSLYDVNDLISIKRKDLIWVCPPAAEVVELFIFLAQPCHTCQLLLTVAHGSEDITSPISFDVRTGRYVDGLKLILEGATVPKCANGTKLLYSLPGAMNPEDVAITGAGSRPSGLVEQSFPWLYEFEEQEGELDFLTRVVAVTFYPASPGRVPITLGEIEVLGFSLPWQKMFANVNSYMKTTSTRLEKEENADSMRMQNPFLVPPVNADGLSGQTNLAVKSYRSPNALDHGLDLLTGDTSESTETLPTQLIVSREGTQPCLTSSWDLFNLHAASPSDNSDDHKFSSAFDNTKDEMRDATDNYLLLFKQICGSDMARPLEFSEALELEISRFDLRLSAAQRDRALLSLGVDPACLDPNRLLSSSYLVQLHQVANQLGVVSQIMLEDEELAGIGFEKAENKETQLSIKKGLQIGCGNTECEIKIKWKYFQHSFSTKSTGVSVCCTCQKIVCDACKVGKGAALLAYGSTSSGTLGGNSLTSFIRGSPIPEGVLCRNCCPQLFLDAILLNHVKLLASLRRQRCITAAALNAVIEIVGNEHNSYFSSLSEKRGGLGSEDAEQSLQAILKGESSLAEFPYATLLTSVEADKGSASPLSLLLGPFLGSQNTYWKAPCSIPSVELTIVLTTLSAVSGIILLVSSCGYSQFDTPTVDVWCGNWMTEKERTYVGRWDLAAEAATAPSLYGAESSGRITVPRHVFFRFNKYVRCRILWLKFTLQHTRLRSPSFTGLVDTNFDLISLDAINSSKPYQRDPAGCQIENAPCIHARRIIIVGKHLQEDADLTPSIQAPEKFAWRNMVEQPAQFGRFKVQVEAEKYRESDRVVEHVVSPSAPSIAGFRIDSLTLIKNSLIHTSMGSESSPLDIELSNTENLLINPSTLFIRVAALQDSRTPVPVGCYMLPIAPVGTPLYFDFAKPIQARELIFELLGDIAHFSSEMAEGDSSLRDPPLAIGLSLANKIRLYRYASAAEMGKWALLSSV